MKTCNEIQQALRDRFDLGEDISAFAEDHVDDCEDCWAYRDELAALARELTVFEPEPAPEDLAARVSAHVRKHRADGGLRLRDYAALSGVAGATMLVAGWYAPPLFDISTSWADPQTWLAQWQTLFQAPVASGWLSGLRSAMNSAQSSMPAIPQTILWPALALSCACAIAFNAFFALRMRTAGE